MAFPKHHMNLDESDTYSSWGGFFLVFGFACLFFGILLGFAVGSGFLLLLLGVIPIILMFLGAAFQDQNTTGDHRRAAKAFDALAKEDRESLNFVKKDIWELEKVHANSVAIKLEKLREDRDKSIRAEKMLDPTKDYMLESIDSQRKVYQGRIEKYKELS